MSHQSSVPQPGELFPPRLVEVLADLSCVVFRREMSPTGDISYPYLSDNVAAIFGYAPADMTVSSKGALNALHWADRDAHVAAILRSAVTMGRCLEAFRVVTADGETRWLRGSSSPMRLDDGRVAWEGAWIDISPWMRAEHQFQTVMDHAEDSILTLDAANGIDWANAAAERLFGWTLDEMLGRCLADLLDAPCKGSGPCSLAACQPADVIQCFPRGTQEVTARHKDGSSFPFEMTVSEVRSDGRLSLIVIGRDITRRKATELMLEETERRLRSIASNLPGVVFQRVRDPDGSFAYPYVSEGIVEILGCDATRIVFDSRLMFDAMVAEDRERLLDALRISAETLTPVREDVRVHGPGGRIRWLRGQSRPRRRDESIVWDGLLLDVTEEVEERIKAEKAVRESEERFRLAFNAAALGIVLTTLDGTILQANPAFHAMCGLDSADLRGQSLLRFVERDHLPEPADMPLPGDSVCFVYAPHLPDGEERHWRITGTTFAATPNATAPSLLLLIEDVTLITRAAAERRQLELTLTEGQKLEALGRLAGGVAHELNNMLGPILMAAEMLKRTAQLDDRNHERAQRIIDAAKHSGDIVRNVLAYCRKEQKTLGRLDIVPVFTQFASLAASILPPTVRVETRIEVATAEVTGDAGQITQVLLNLVNNARDAMDGKGVLGLTLRPLAPGALTPPRSHAGRLRPADGHDRHTLVNPLAALDPGKSYVEITIADTGHGMTPETVAKIFDPFFTTKPVGQGTGLGLSVVQGIIKAMGGAVTVESAIGGGTSFRIVLPRASLPADTI
ncbi:MAG TPA: PAS domain S-box protein [Candidatus Omnitrophota bacterium]|nr:PAS domain S-box protein [Candidatus Omnitrophota bacterium]